MSLTLPQIEKALSDTMVDYEIWPCDEALADTVNFCAHYNVSVDHSVNAILVQDKYNQDNHALCLVTAGDRLDVNGTVRKKLGAKKASFASADFTKELTGMEIGGVTPVGLPHNIPIWIDAKIRDLTYIILGGGNRTSKLKIDPAYFDAISEAEFIENLARS